MLAQRGVGRLAPKVQAPSPRGLSIRTASTSKKQMMMWEALREATDEEMERDPTVCVMGEDVGHYGGSYKVTYGLYKKYGEMRVMDTTICGESDDTCRDKVCGVRSSRIGT